jgi:hypothetical protein
MAAAVSSATPDSVAEVRETVLAAAGEFAAPDGTLRIPARTWVASAEG